MRRAALIAAASLALAQGGAAGEAEAIWAKSCARCHRDIAKVQAGVPGGDLAARAEWLRNFLPRHHAPDAAAVSVLADWLAQG